MIHYATRFPPGKPIILLNDSIVRKTATCSMEKSFLFMDALIKHFISHPDPLVVPVYAYEPFVMQNDFEYHYSYDMMRLGLLPPEERSLVDDVGNLMDKYGRYAWDEADLNFQIKSKRHPKLSLFLKTICHQDRYHDIHSGNVMIDLEEDYRLIDLEGFLHTPLELSENNWITRE